MARLFVAYANQGKQSPVGGVADAFEERRRQQVAEKFAKEDQELKRVGLDLERQGLRLRRSEIAQRGQLLAMELESRERMQGVEQAGLDRRQDSAQGFQASESAEQRTFAAEQSDLDRKATARQNRQERKARMEELQARIESAEQIAQDRIDAEAEQLEAQLDAQMERLQEQLADAEAARSDAKAQALQQQITQIMADRMTQIRAIKAKKDEYTAQIKAQAQRQKDALDAEADRDEKNRRFTSKQKRLDREFTTEERKATQQYDSAQRKRDRDAASSLQSDRLRSAENISDNQIASAEKRDQLRADTQMDIAEMQYGMPGGLGQETAATLDAQIESLDRIFAGLPEGQRPPAAAMKKGKEALQQARDRIINARTREEYNAAVSDAGALYKSYQQEMEAAGQAVFTNRQNDRYTELMEWAGSDVGREHGITEARLAEVVSGDPSKRAEDISNLVQMKQAAQAYRRAELAIDALDETQSGRIQSIATLTAARAAEGGIDVRNLTPSQKLAYEAYQGMNDIGLSMSERAQAAQTLLRYANMTDDDAKFVDLTLEQQRQEAEQVTLEKDSAWARSALAGPGAEFTEQDIMSSDFQDNLVSLAAMGDPDASAALSIITEQDYESLGAGGYRQLWAQVGNQLGPQGIMRLGMQLSKLSAGELQPEVWADEGVVEQPQGPTVDELIEQDTRPRGSLPGMRTRLEQGKQ